MCEETSRALPNETGGVLLGYWIRERREVVVSGVVGPGPRARNTRKSFRPDYAFQENEIARLYQQSGRRLQYLGDWHSHPTGGISLSRKDKRTLREIASFAQARCPTPLMGVIAGRPRWRVGVWCDTRGTDSLSKRAGKVSLLRAKAWGE